MTCSEHDPAGKVICLSGTFTTLLMPGDCLVESLQGSDHSTCMRRTSLFSPWPAGRRGSAAQEARKACLDVMLLAVEQEEPGSALQAADLLKQVTAHTGYPAQHGLHHSISMLRHDRLAPTMCTGVPAPSAQALGALLLRQLPASMAALLVLYPKLPGLLLWWQCSPCAGWL